MEKLTFSGRLVTGAGQGASFTRLPWVRDQLLDLLGIDPYPGTLNLALDTTVDRARWNGLKALPGCRITPPGPEWCEARGYAVRIEGRLPGAIVLPEVSSYSGDQMEIIAALPLREALSRTDGELVRVEVVRPLPVRAVIFDVDGTLVDSIPAARLVAEEVSGRYGLRVTDEAMREALNTTRPFWDLVLPEDLQDRREVIRGLREEVRRLWPEALRRHGRAFPGLRATLEDLRSRGARLAIVTGARQGSFAPLREEGLMDFFGSIVTASDVERVKPHPEALIKCAAALEVEAHEAVYVGDTPVDVRAARAAGFASVAVLSGAGDSALLSAAGPDLIIRSHATLPAALEIV